MSDRHKRQEEAARVSLNEALQEYSTQSEPSSDESSNDSEDHPPSIVSLLIRLYDLLKVTFEDNLSTCDFQRITKIISEQIHNEPAIERAILAYFEDIGPKDAEVTSDLIEIVDMVGLEPFYNKNEIYFSLAPKRYALIL